MTVRAAKQSSALLNAIGYACWHRVKLPTQPDWVSAASNIAKVKSCSSKKRRRFARAKQELSKNLKLVVVKIFFFLFLNMAISLGNEVAQSV